jgi:SSS family transporter
MCELTLSIDLIPRLLAQTAPSMPAAAAEGSLSGHWTWIDWLVLVGYLAATTWLGHALAGKQATIRDFFLGGRKLPWYAVAGSIVATEISAVTFVSVPFVVFKPGGNLTYLQLGVFGALFARLIVAYVLVPQYYKREIFSPYDYMDGRLGSGVRSMTTALFSLTGLLAQSSRVYLTAVVLSLILRPQLLRFEEWTGIGPIAASVFIIGVVAILWTLMGGITTVIWTDVALFIVFLLGALTALLTVAFNLPGGLAELFTVGWEAGKFQFFNYSPSPLETYTIWTAVIASTWGSVGAYGTDQLMAQRIFCCNGPREARKAVVASYLGQIVTVLVMLVGIGLYAYYSRYPLQGESLEAYNRKGDQIFPIFILSVIPTGLTGLIIAGIFAAAISSLDSILAALAQTSMSAFYLPMRDRARRKAGLPPVATDDPLEARRLVRTSRFLVIFWGILLCAMALLAEQAAKYYPSILDLALSMAGYAGGALLAGFLLAFLPLRINGVGFLFSAPLSVLTIVGLVWHQPWAWWVCVIGGAVLVAVWIATRVVPASSDLMASRVGKLLFLALGVGLMLFLNQYAYAEDPVTGAARSIAWPWYSPIGSTVAFLWGWILADRKNDPDDLPATARKP